MEMRLFRLGNSRFAKKAFAFTFLAFFLSIIIFAYVYLNLGKDDFTKDNTFKESRISSIDSELKYFKNTYVKSAIKYSLYNSLNSLLNYSNSTSGKLDEMASNYSYFNNLVSEGMYHGSFNAIPQDFLLGNVDGVNKTLKYFVEQFKTNFDSTYKGNFSFEIKDVNIYEKDPYYVSIQILAIYSVTTLDNISSWNFKDNFDVAIPVYDLIDPKFFYENDFIIPIRPSERYLSLQNWTIQNFNQSLNNGYTQVYLEPNYKYTLGDSYLSRFLGLDLSSYKDVVGFWSFDYDEELGDIFDSSLYSNNSKHYGNSRLLYSFDNGTVVGNDVFDGSDYSNKGEIYGDVNCSVAYSGVFGNREGCTFDGDGDYIGIDNSESLNFSNTSFSVSLWFNDFYNENGGGYFYLYKKYISPTQGYSYGLYRNFNQTTLGFYVKNVSGEVTFISFDWNETNSWHNLVGIYDGEYLKLYLDGFLKVSKFVPEIGGVVFDNSNLFLGKWNTNYFNGTIDELAVYSKALSDSEVAMLFEEKKVKHIDYVDTMHGKGIEFDGVDDWINVSYNLIYSDNFSVELWFKMNGYPNPLDDESLLIRDPYIGINSSTYNLIYYNYGINDEQDPEDGYYEGVKKIKLGMWNHVVVTFSNSTGDFNMYLNGELDNVMSNKFGKGRLDIKNIGGEPTTSIGRFFKGIIDEVKIYNGTLSKEEILYNYYNYDSFSKGCCNYLSPVNYNLFGYNTSANKKNISSSSKIFYKYEDTNPLPDMILFNVTNLSSQDTQIPFYNLMFDKCLADAYDIFSYEDDLKNIHVDVVDSNANIGIDCKDLVKEGYY